MNNTKIDYKDINAILSIDNEKKFILVTLESTDFMTTDYNFILNFLFNLRDYMYNEISKNISNFKRIKSVKNHENGLLFYLYYDNLDEKNKQLLLLEINNFLEKLKIKFNDLNNITYDDVNVSDLNKTLDFI